MYSLCTRRFAIAVVLLLCCSLADAQTASHTIAARPFPHHTAYAPDVIRPSRPQAEMDTAVQSHHAAWKTQYLRRAGGDGTWVKYDKTNSTVSEAHGYGMVIAAYMADKPVFDSMRSYFRAHPSVNAPHLMAWKQTLRNGRMVNVEGADSATDGDLDIAYALLLADVQWGSNSGIDYRSEAIAVMHDILAHEVNADDDSLKPGDWARGADARHTRPSDFMTDHLLAFAQADTANAAQWMRVVDRVSVIVNDQFSRGSARTGLMPDFMVKSGARFVPVRGKYLESRHDGDFSYNACRTPWRLAMSHIVQGRNEMLGALQTQASWIASAARYRPTGIRAGYSVRNGKNGKAFVNYDDLAFTAPFAVNAMVGGASSQDWLDHLWTSITGGDYGPVVDYFGDTIRLQVLITVSGNWWVP
jgi:endoglucanase